MQIQLDGAAIKELVAALEAAEGDDARAAVDKRIVKRGADIAKPDMARRIPRAADHKKSGSAWSKPSGGPAADKKTRKNPATATRPRWAGRWTTTANIFT